MKAQDLAIAVKILSYQGSIPGFAKLGEELEISPSQAHVGINRLEKATIFSPATKTINIRNLYEFCAFGVKYLFPPVIHGVVEGIPTGFAHPDMSKEIRPSEEPFVWSHDSGSVRGQSLEPIFRSIPNVSLHDLKFYKIFSLIDAIRTGKAREREVACELLKKAIYE